MPDFLWPHELQHARPPCPSPTPGVHPNPCPLCPWCHQTISSSVVPFCCIQYFPASGSFPVSYFFSSGGQSIRVSASASVLPVNIQDWFPLGFTGLISLCCRKADPFQGPKLGPCLTLRNELSEKTHVLTKQEILLGKGSRVEGSRVREPRRTALPHGLQSWVLWW